MSAKTELEMRHNVVFVYDYMTISVTLDRPESDDTDAVIADAYAVLRDYYGIDIEPNDTDIDSWGLE